MYNGIGLQTARGSGTNGYVQANKFLVRHQKTKIERKDFADGQGQGGVLRRANKDILDHEKKRQIELKILLLQESLEEEGYDEEEIEKKVDELRQELEAANAEVVVEGFALNAQETHQIALRKEKKMEVFRDALGLQNVREGEAFDRELQEQRKLERIAEREAKREEEKKQKEAEEKAKKDAEKAAKRKAKEEKREKKRLARKLEKQKEAEERRLRKEKKAAVRRAAEEEAARLALEAKKAEEAARQLRGDDRWQPEDELADTRGVKGEKKRRRHDSDDDDVEGTKSGRRNDEEDVRKKTSRETGGKREGDRSRTKGRRESDVKRRKRRYPSESDSESESELSSSESELSSDSESEREAVKRKRRAVAPVSPPNEKKQRHDSPLESEPEVLESARVGEERAPPRPPIRSAVVSVDQERVSGKGDNRGPNLAPPPRISPYPARKVTLSPQARKNLSLSRDISPPPVRDIRRERTPSSGSESPSRSISPPPRRRLSPDWRARSPPRRGPSPFRGGARLRGTSPPPARGGRYQDESPRGRARRPSPFRARSPPRRGSDRGLETPPRRREVARSAGPRGYRGEDDRRWRGRGESPVQDKNGRDLGRRERSPAPRRRSPSSSRSPAPRARTPVARGSRFEPDREAKVPSVKGRSPVKVGARDGEGSRKPLKKRAESESSDSYSGSLSDSSSEDDSPIHRRAVSGKAAEKGTLSSNPLVHEGLESAPGVPKARPVSAAEEEARVKRVRLEEKEGQEAAEQQVALAVAAAKQRAEGRVAEDGPEKEKETGAPGKRQRHNDSDLEDEAQFEKAKAKEAPSKRALSKSESDDLLRKKGKPSAEPIPAKAEKKGDDLLKKVTKEAPKAGRMSRRHTSSESDFSHSGTGSSFTGSSYSDSESDSEQEKQPRQRSAK